LANCGVVGRTIIIENQWMIRRDISYTLLKIAYRIAARGHHIAQQLVGVGNCASGAVNKPRLHSSPGFDEPRTIARREWPDVQAFHALGTLVEHRFCLPPTPAFCHGAAIFSPSKLCTQSLRLPLPKGEHNADGYGCHQHNGDDDLYWCQA
jgi:hypothetical protein